MAATLSEKIFSGRAFQLRSPPGALPRPPCETGLIKQFYFWHSCSDSRHIRPSLILSKTFGACIAADLTRHSITWRASFSQMHGCLRYGGMQKALSLTIKFSRLFTFCVVMNFFFWWAVQKTLFILSLLRVSQQVSTIFACTQSILSENIAKVLYARKGTGLFRVEHRIDNCTAVRKLRATEKLTLIFSKLGVT